MANPHRGEVALQVGDRSLTLSFSVNAIVELEDLMDESVTVIGEKLGDAKAFRMKTARAVLWAGLQDHHPDISLQEAGAIASEIGIGPCMEAVGKAFTLAFPKSKKDAAPRPRKAAKG